MKNYAKNSLKFFANRKIIYNFAQEMLKLSVSQANLVKNDMTMKNDNE